MLNYGSLAVETNERHVHYWLELSNNEVMLVFMLFYAKFFCDNSNALKMDLLSPHLLFHIITITLLYISLHILLTL